MKSKLIIIMLSVLLIISIITNIVLYTKLNNKADNTSSDATNNKIVGIYHTNNYTDKYGVKNKQGAITLNKDNTCIYFDDTMNSCTYTASDNNVSITLTNYNVVRGDGVSYSIHYYPTMQECDVELKKISDDNKDTELLCKKYTYNHTLTITKNGALLDNNILLDKVN